MSIVTMEMSGYEIERNDSTSYGDEVMCAGWNPALALRPHTENRKRLSMPADMLAIPVDAETFLRRMYAYQH